MKLWALTTVGEKLATDRNGNKYMAMDARCVGVFEYLNRAFWAVTRNDSDIYEMGSYPHAVIELIESDVVYGGFVDEAPMWFAWEGDVGTGGYKSCPCPDKYKKTVGFWS